MNELINKIISIENEENRRSQNKLSLYNKGEKIHRKQMEFHQSSAANRWVFGGNRTGKTECGAVETVWLARGIHPYRKNRKNISCWVVSLSAQVQRDVAQAKILDYIDKSWIIETVMTSGRKDSPDNGVIDYILIKNVFGGISKIGFKSCEAGREKFQGTSLDFVWFDEEPPQDIYHECKMRVFDRKGFIFGTMTPLKGLTFVYDEIYLNKGGDKEVWSIFIEWADNPFLSAEEIERLGSTMSADALSTRRYGRFNSSCGLVYGEFDPSVHVIEPFDVPNGWYDKISIDPGLNNPTSVHWYAVDGDGVVYVIAEHYEAKREITYHALKIKEICDRLGWESGSFGINALIDSAANQKTLAAVKSVAELFYENGINVNTNVNKDVFSGINRVKSYLKPLNGKPRLYIFSTCVNMIKEIKSYWWGEGEKPVKTNDHAMDELRYYISSRPEAFAPSAHSTQIQKDIMNLIKKKKNIFSGR
ncbi:MAG TPA: terminase family protein [Eubacteriales bacterium]|nr:terminase family protein [Eubacteriales bacterium]